MEKVKKSEEEWRAELTPEQYEIVREKGTEAPFTSELNDNKAAGTYRCVACGEPLFSSETTKFDSGTGWPSFYAPMDDEKVETEEDNSLLMRRTEVLCSLRRPPRARLRRRTGGDNRPPLLHQRLRPRVRRGPELTRVALSAPVIRPCRRAPR